MSEAISARRAFWVAALVVGLVGLVAAAALAQAAAPDPARPSVLALVAKWLPLVFSGFLLNLLVSVLSMAIGTALGVPLGLAQIARQAVPARAAAAVTQFCRNAPWLVL